jgi:uncharacterized damage-inducible protein DinB
MKNDVSKVCADLQQVADDARSTFGTLSAEQLNWKPAEKSWSIAQCFDHLITTHSLYFPLFERLANGDLKASVWEKISPLSGFFGRFLIKSLRPENAKKMKTTSKAYPSSSAIDGDIIERYWKHQDELIEAIRKVPSDIDAEKTIVTSPLMGLVTYSLDDCYTILVVHGPRHFNQAKHVMENQAFPS